MGQNSRVGRHRAAPSPLLRPVIFTAVVSATLAAVVSSPAYAAPPIPGIPDAGSRPAATGTLSLPGAPGTAGTTPGGTGGVTQNTSLTGNPIAAELEAKQTEVSQAGQRLLALEEQVSQATAAAAVAEQQVTATSTALATAQAVTDSAASEALKEEAALPPGTFGSDLYKIGSLWRVPRDSNIDAERAARDLARAQDAALAALTARDAALAAETQVRAQFTTMQASLKALEQSLLTLRETHEDELTAIAAQQDAAEAALGADYVDNTTTDGMTAHPKALAALAFAMSQRGKWYEWAAEGPETYDCSGLMWAAYRQGAGYYGLPRVANDQYYATRGKTVSKSALLPGDLIFFSTSNRWSDVYHVGMYVGDGKMVNAPTTGEVVKVQSIHWSRFFAATRVFGAVEAPDKGDGTPKPKPTPTPSPTPDPTKPPTPGSPTPTPTPSTPGSPSPSPTTPPPITTPPTKPTPTPSKSATPTGPPSEQPSTEPSNSASAGASASASASASRSAAASSSASSATSGSASAASSSSAND
jgi:peptidoglycan DL-endopeptidase CwlO